MPTTNTGRKLLRRGLEDSQADWVAHVCFDSQRFPVYGKSAPCIFFYKPKIAADLAASRSGVYGSRKGSSETNTGFGANLLPTELSARMEEFNPDPSFASLSLGARGVAEAKKFYMNHGYTVRNASTYEDIHYKFDFVATKEDVSIRVEVKSRGSDKAYSKLFVQTHEANPDKRIE